MRAEDRTAVKAAIDRARRAQGTPLPPDPPKRIPWQQKGATAQAQRRADRYKAELADTRRELRQAQKRIRQLEHRVNALLGAGKLRRVA